MRAMDRTDIALLVCTGDDIEKELEWSRLLKEKNIPVIWILNKADLLTDVTSTIRSIEKKMWQVPLGVSACTKQGMEDIRRSLIAKLPDETMSRGIVGNWWKKEIR